MMRKHDNFENYIYVLEIDQKIDFAILYISKASEQLGKGDRKGFGFDRHLNFFVGLALSP